MRRFFIGEQEDIYNKNDNVKTNGFYGSTILVEVYPYVYILIGDGIRYF